MIVHVDTAINKKNRTKVFPDKNAKPDAIMDKNADKCAHYPRFVVI